MTNIEIRTNAWISWSCYLEKSMMNTPKPELHALNSSTVFRAIGLAFDFSFCTTSMILGNKAMCRSKHDNLQWGKTCGTRDCIAWRINSVHKVQARLLVMICHHKPRAAFLLDHVEKHLSDFSVKHSYALPVQIHGTTSRMSHLQENGTCANCFTWLCCSVKPATTSRNC